MCLTIKPVSELVQVHWPLLERLSLSLNTSFEIVRKLNNVICSARPSCTGWKLGWLA